MPSSPTSRFRLDDQVAHLARLGDVPVGMGDDGHAAGCVDQLDGLLGARPASRHERLRARHQILLEEGAEVGPGARRTGDMGTPDRVRGPGLGDRGLEGDLDAVAVQPLDDLPSPV